MTPIRVVGVILALLLGALLAVGAWGQPPQSRLSDDDYIAIALSDPQVFHPTGPSSGGRVVAEGVERRGSDVIVTVRSDGTRFRVTIDARSDRITSVQRQ